MPENIDIAELLVAQNIITRAQQRECLDVLRENPDRILTDVVVERGLCTREAIAQAVARFNNYAVSKPNPEEAVASYEHVAGRTRANTDEMVKLADRISRMFGKD